MNKSKLFIINILIFFIIIYLPFDNNAQNIFTGDVNLTTQAEVNTFGANNYTGISGSLMISGRTNYPTNNITDLSPLSSLTSIGDALRIDYLRLLPNVDGLGNVQSVGGFLLIGNNDVLTNIDGLSSISFSNGVEISYNSLLTNINGLSSTTSVNDYLIVGSNSSLASIDGLSNITSVNGYLIVWYNFVLVNLDGLNNIATVTEYIDIRRNDLITNLDGLNKLTSIGGNLLVLDNGALNNLDGLIKLTSIGGELRVSLNNSLNSFCGLYPLLSSGGLVGTYTVNNNSTTSTSQVDILNHCGSFSVNSKAFLEGPYNSTNSNMNTTLSSIPLNSPFTEDPKSVGSIPADVVDWVLLQLRGKLNPSTIVGNRSAFILKNGNIVDTDGTSPVLFPEIAIEYFLSVKHRNHLSAMSAVTIK